MFVEHARNSLADSRDLSYAYLMSHPKGHEIDSPLKVLSFYFFKGIVGVTIRAFDERYLEKHNGI